MVFMAISRPVLCLLRGGLAKWITGIKKYRRSLERL